MSFNELFSLAFAALVLMHVALQLYLIRRQAHSVTSHRDTVPVDFAQQVDLPSHQKAADYTLAKLQLATVTVFWEAALMLAWTLLGGLEALRLALITVMGNGLVSQLMLVIGFILLSGLLSMPFSYYSTFVLEEKFDFNRSTLRLWIMDALKGAVLGLLLGVPLLWAVMALMVGGGSLWWLYAWLLLLLWQTLMLVLAPRFLMPLFNRFEPLQEESLKTRIQSLLEKAGFTSSGIFVMDGSRRSAHANAFFTGLGRHKRIVFFDTLMQQLKPSEIESVLAHELGHYHHGHIRKALLWSAITTLFGLAALGWLSQQEWFYAGLGVSPPLGASSPGLALLLFSMVVPLLLFFWAPVRMHRSRRHEFEADAFAVRMSSATDLSNALLQMYKSNAGTLTPDPWYTRFHASHPSAAERLAHLRSLATVSQT